MPGAWHRDLNRDLDTIRDWGAAAVVTLLKPAELTLLKVERLGEEVFRRNMSWFYLPIADVSTPDQEWDVAGKELRSILRSSISERDRSIHRISWTSSTAICCRVRTRTT
jgi:ADP-ribosyl-[dinitrogen reductase] hydrolase